MCAQKRLSGWSVFRTPVSSAPRPPSAAGVSSLSQVRDLVHVRASHDSLKCTKIAEFRFNVSKKADVPESLRSLRTSSSRKIPEMSTPRSGASTTACCPAGAIARCVHVLRSQDAMMAHFYTATKTNHRAFLSSSCSTQRADTSEWTAISRKPWHT